MYRRWGLWRFIMREWRTWNETVWRFVYHCCLVCYPPITASKINLMYVESARYLHYESTESHSTFSLFSQTVLIWYWRYLRISIPSGLDQEAAGSSRLQCNRLGISRTQNPVTVIVLHSAWTVTFMLFNPAGICHLRDQIISSSTISTTGDGRSASS